MPWVQKVIEKKTKISSFHNELRHSVECAIVLSDKCSQGILHASAVDRSNDCSPDARFGIHAKHIATTNNCISVTK